MRIHRFRSLLTAVGLLVATLTAAVADSSIRVLVNDKAITSYDISQRLRLMQITREKGGQKAAVEGLIDEILEVMEAKRRGIDVSDARINLAYQGIAQSMKMSVPQFDKALASEGIVPDTLKRRIKAQMVWGQLVQAKARFEVSVKPSDITAALFAEKPEKLAATEFTVQQIIFVVPKGSSGGYIAQRRREAEAFRLRYKGCDGAVAQAKQLRDVVVRPVTRRTSAELTDKLGKEVQETAVGKTTRPSQADAGLMVIGVCTARKLTGDSTARTEIENRLFVEQGKDVGKDFLKELRAKAIIKYR